MAYHDDFYQLHIQLCLTIIIPVSIPVEDLEHSTPLQHFKMNVLEPHESTEIESFIKNSLDPEAVVFSDKSTSYFYIGNDLEKHITKKSIKATSENETVLSIYYKINGQYLPYCSDEFVYKLNITSGSLIIKHNQN